MNTNYTTDKQNSKQLRNEVHEDINNINRDIDEIQRRMTPGQILDDAIFGRGTRNTSETFDYLKSNPLGTSLITLGALCLMEDENHQSYEHIAKNKAHEVEEKLASQYHSTQDSLRSKVHNAEEKMHHMQDQIKDKIHSVRKNEEQLGFEGLGLGEGMDVEGFGQEIKNAKEKLNTKIHESKEKINEKIHSVEQRLKDRTHSTIESAKQLDPMTYLALGAGLGTITGASLPVTEREKSMLHSKYEHEFTEFAHDLELAINESANILKNQFVGGFSEINLNLF